MYQEKAQFNTAIYCTKCSVPLYLANTHYISVVREVKPVNLCNKCFAELVKRAGESIRTYHVFADVTILNRYTVKATNEQEAIEKVKQGEFDEVDPVTSDLPEILDAYLVRENE